MDLPNEGYYQATVVRGSIDRAGRDQKGNWQYVLRIRVTGEYDVQDDPTSDLLEMTTPLTRHIYLTFTKNSKDIAFQALSRLGFDDQSLQTLGDWNPAGIEFLVRCKHDTYKGRIRGKWEVAAPPRPEIPEADLEDFASEFGSDWEDYQDSKNKPPTEYFEEKAALQDR